jgi:hypothetical protein
LPVHDAKPGSSPSLGLLWLLIAIGCGTTPAPAAPGVDAVVLQDVQVTDAVAQDSGATPDAAPQSPDADVADGPDLAGDLADAEEVFDVPDVPVAPTPCQADLDCVGKLAGLKPCQLAHCDVVTGQCQAELAPKYWPCDDGDPCTLGTLCVGGKCSLDTGVVAACDDSSPCTQDLCDKSNPGADSATGCVHLPVSATCSDGNACTDADLCQGGQCVGQASSGCGCQIDEDCLPFEDGDLCNGRLACKPVGGGKVAKACMVDLTTVVQCPEHPGACFVEACDKSLGQCVKKNTVDLTACEDGQPCTKASVCQAGKCVGGEPICTCSSNADCTAFDDGNPCNGVLACTAGKCQVQSGTVVVCPSKGSCTDNACNPASGQCEQKPKLDGAACEDGNPCTVGETCANFQCSGGILNPCDDNNACTTDFCAGSCSHVPTSNIACEDGDLCTQGETCQQGKCKGGTPIECDDKSVCTDDACEPKSGCVHVKLDIPCNDLNACTAGEACSNGSCLGGSPLQCDDKNPCTDDSCDVGKGCVHVNSAAFCDTGDNCTSPGSCKDGKCLPAKNKCVDCIVDKDCLAQDDGNLCNGTPVCVDGECVADLATVITCDTAGDTACILTFCNALTGQCQKDAAPGGTKCDDGNACSASDVCSAGLCKAGIPAAKSDTCPGDICGDGYCKKGVETCETCQADCGNCLNNCGDGKCEFLDDGNTQQETCDNCQADCGKCGAGCKAAATLFCGSDQLWSTASQGATDGVDTLAGACTGGATGNEFAYAFQGACDGPVELTLTPGSPGQPLTVYVLDGQQGCGGGACLQAGTAKAGAQTLTVQVKKGKLYYVVVDSGGKPGEYEIAVGCQCGPPVVCGDGKCDGKKEDCTNCAKDCGACQTCGDGQCLKGTEDCTTCAVDCGKCSTCGDGQCLAPAEDCLSCPADCKTGCSPCGDGKCDILGTESCSTCASDCGACPKTCQPLPLSTTCGSVIKGAINAPGSTQAIANWSCLAGNHGGHEVAYTFGASCSGLGYIKVVRDAGTTGNVDILIVDSSKACDGSSCVAFAQMINGTAIANFAADKGKSYQIVLDSTVGATAGYTLTTQCFGCTDGCGNQTCDAGETCSNCSVDCGLCTGCGDKVCGGTESCQTCPGDCGQCSFCGDGKCNPGEDCKSCVKDCGQCPAVVCGDGKCDATSETCNNCAKDCGPCAVVTPGCSASPKAGCDGCACEACVCAQDDYCCSGKWTAYCASLCVNACGGKCQ